MAALVVGGVSQLGDGERPSEAPRGWGGHHGRRGQTTLDALKGRGTAARVCRVRWWRPAGQARGSERPRTRGGPVLPSPPPAGRDSKKLSLGLSPPCRHLVQWLAGPRFVLGTRGE